MRFASACLLSSMLLAAAELSTDELKMLHDPSGWQYITMSEPGSGINTDHPCFDGQPHPDTCSGKLLLNEQGSFQQITTIHGQNVQRRGRYTLSNGQLTFIDELQHEDGPYALRLDAKAKSLDLDGDRIHIGMLLDSEFHRRLREKSNEAH